MRAASMAARRFDKVTVTFGIGIIAPLLFVRRMGGVHEAKNDARPSRPRDNESFD